MRETEKDRGRCRGGPGSGWITLCAGGDIRLSLSSVLEFCAAVSKPRQDHRRSTRQRQSFAVKSSRPCCRHLSSRPRQIRSTLNPPYRSPYRLVRLSDPRPSPTTVSSKFRLFYCWLRSIPIWISPVGRFPAPRSRFGAPPPGKVPPLQSLGTAEPLPCGGAMCRSSKKLRSLDKELVFALHNLLHIHLFAPAQISNRQRPAEA